MPLRFLTDNARASIVVTVQATSLNEKTTHFLLSCFPFSVFRQGTVRRRYKYNSLGQCPSLLVTFSAGAYAIMLLVSCILCVIGLVLFGQLLLVPPRTLCECEMREVELLPVHSISVPHGTLIFVSRGTRGPLC